MYWDVFISHSDIDKVVANKIAHALDENFYVWYDDFNLILGDDIESAIENGLKLSSFGLVLLSKNFFKNYNSSLKKKELRHFVENVVRKQKTLLPIWYKIDKSYLERQIKKYGLNPELLKIKAIKIEGKSQLPTQLIKIISEIKKHPKQKFATQKKIKYDEIDTIVLNQNDLLDGWEVENDDASGEWETRIDFFHPEKNITLTNAVYYRDTIAEMRDIFTDRKNEASSRMRDERLANPKLGQESYGYRYNGGSLVFFRISNISIRIQLDKPNTRPKISEPKAYARIVDRNIRSLLTRKRLA